MHYSSLSALPSPAETAGHTGQSYEIFNTKCTHVGHRSLSVVSVEMGYCVTVYGKTVYSQLATEPCFV